MSGKSRRRGRRLSRSQRKKAGRVVAAPVVESAVPAPKAASPVAAKAPVATKAPAPRAAVAESPNISGELKRIGLVGGIIVALLVAAYFVLPLVL